MEKKLDIVYFVKESPDNEELRYSLRSVAKNLPHNSVYIIGGCPSWVRPSHYIKITQTGRTKWERVRNMYRTICLNEAITEDFILFNDDFYVMKKTEDVKPAYRCSLAEHILTIEAKFNDTPNEYTKLLRNAYARLKTLNKATNSYELHIPMVFNRHKMLEILGAFPDMHCMRTLYGNYFDIGGDQMEDVKILSSGEFPKDNVAFLSSDDKLFNPDEPIMTLLEQTFKQKCQYEVEL